MFSRLTNRLSNGLYNISKKRRVPSSFLPLYNSRHFASTPP